MFHCSNFRRSASILHHYVNAVLDESLECRRVKRTRVQGLKFKALKPLFENYNKGDKRFELCNNWFKTCWRENCTY